MTMDITVTTKSDTPEQKNVAQEHRLTADSRTHVAIHLGHGMYLHLDVWDNGQYWLRRGDYAHEWLSDTVAEGHLYTEIAENVNERTLAHKQYQRLCARVLDNPATPVGDDLIDAVFAYGVLHNVRGADGYDSGFNRTTDQKRRAEYLADHPAQEEK